MQIKRCQNCKAIRDLDACAGTKVVCEKCREVHDWMFWIDITGTAAAKEYMELNNIKPQVDTTIIDGQIKQAELFALLWIAKIHSGAYKLSTRQRGREPTDEEKKEGHVIGWRDMTDEEKLRTTENTAVTHIMRVEELHSYKAKMLKGEV